MTPAQAVEYEHEDDYNNVINSVKDKAIKPSPFQNSYAEGQVVRLRIPKGKLDKFDKPNWSEQKYTITTVLQQSEDNINHTSAKPTRYKITPFGINYSKSLRIHHIHVIRLPYLQYTRQAPSVVMVELMSSVVSKWEELQEDFL